MGCLVDDAAVHPSQPWLALACTNAEANLGAVLLVDLDTGTLRSTTLIEDYVGWPATDVLRWHPDGELLATNVGTNGIAVLENGEVLGMAFPDETRDTPVGFVWVGDHLFADTGAFFRVDEGEEPRFDFDEQASPPFQTLAWNEAIGAAVGRVGEGLAAWDPRAERVRWTNDLTDHPRGAVDCRADGRRCVRRQFGTLGDPDALLFVDGDTGKVLGRRLAAGPNLGRLRWGPDGLLVTSHRHVVGGPSEARSVQAFRDGESVWSTPLGEREVRASSGVADAFGLAWSPDGAGAALLLDRQEVQLLDGRDGALGIRFLALAKPIPEGLPDWYTTKSALPGAVMWPTAERIVRVSPHFLTVYDTGGAKVGELTMPAR